MKNNVSEAEFLKSEISKNIEILKEKVKISKMKCGLINAFIISLGALVTLTLGMDVSIESVQFQKNLALLLSAVLTIASSWNAFFDYKKLWVRQKNTLLALYQVQNDLGYRMSRDEKCQVDDIFEKYQRVWEKDGGEWRGIYQNMTIVDKDDHEKRRELDA